ncbi:MAG: hypothetical protein K2G67_06440 [Muribaculaceae bacterium]|nr:hypothetical protein [Muribaculaceae bacterium]
MTKENENKKTDVHCESTNCPIQCDWNPVNCQLACENNDKSPCRKLMKSNNTCLRCNVTPIENGPVYHNPTPGMIPILAIPFTNNIHYIADENDFQTLKDAGFNLSSAYLVHITTPFDCIALQTAIGKVRLFLSYAWIGAGQTLEEQVNRTNSYIKDLAKVPGNAFAGVTMCDEPTLKMLTCCRHDSLLNRYKRVQELFNQYNMPGGLQRINLLPVQAFDSVEDFKQYLDTFEYYFKPALITYDCYPVMKHEPLFNLSRFARKYPGAKHSEYLQNHEYFYRNLELFSAHSRATGKPFWAYVMSNSHLTGENGFYPTSLENHLRFEAFSALAYGAKGLGYWRYLQDGDYGGTVFFHAPLNHDESRNAIWYYARRVNREIERYKDVFLETSVQKVCHTNISAMEDLQARCRGIKENTGGYFPMMPIRIENDPDNLDQNGKPKKIYDTHWGLTSLSSSSMPVISSITSDGLGVLVSHLKKLPDFTSPGYSPLSGLNAEDEVNPDSTNMANAGGIADNQDINYLVIVNHDIVRPQTVTISFKGSKTLEELTPLKSGEQPPTDKIRTAQTPSIVRNLPAGGYLIFRWSAPFSVNPVLPGDILS